MWIYLIVVVFTNVPVDEATSVIHGRLREDETLGDRTILYPQRVAELLEMCPEVHLPAMEAMGSPVSAVVANLYMHGVFLRSWHWRRH